MLFLLIAAASPTAPSTTAPAVIEAPAPKPAVPRVLVLDTRAEPEYVEKVKGFGDLIAHMLEQRSAAEIVSSSSVKDRLAAVADRMRAGCEDTECMTEIAGALDARYVVASRVSQVGGRWLVRIELFDSTTLKVVAQVSATGDSVPSLAAQAESLSDGLLAKAPVLARGGAQPADEHAVPPPDAPAKVGPGPWPWVLAAGGTTLAAAALTGWGFAYADASSKEAKLNTALSDYRDDDTAGHRSALAAAGRAADDASTVDDCIAAPIGCLALPLLGAAVWGVYWGSTADKDAP